MVEYYTCLTELLSKRMKALFKGSKEHYKNTLAKNEVRGADSSERGGIRTKQGH